MIDRIFMILVALDEHPGVSFKEQEFLDELSKKHIAQKEDLSKEEILKLEELYASITGAEKLLGKLQNDRSGKN